MEKNVFFLLETIIKKNWWSNVYCIK